MSPLSAMPSMVPSSAAVAGSGLGAREVPRHAVRLLSIAPAGIEVRPFASLTGLLGAGDLLVVNDAATLPASLFGRSEGGARFELRLSQPLDGLRLGGVLLGEGDFRTRTEDRPPPPRLAPGERVTLGALAATVCSSEGRRVELVADGEPDHLWQALYLCGAPVQYAHRPGPLPLWAVQTAYAGPPWAAEMPSAGRPFTWEVLLALRRAGVGLVRLTHAAGLSSTGEPDLDRALPWPERYHIPEPTAAAVARVRAAGGRVIAVGTSVTRALEASSGRPGSGVARLRINAGHRLRLVDGLVSGLHVPGESHFELLSAFAPAARLRQALARAASAGLSGHELGDACLLVRHPAAPTA